jgi:putative ABC transport system substrate-binding protein
MEEKKIRYGVIGIKGVGKRHCLYARQNARAELAAVVDIDSDFLAKKWNPDNPGTALVFKQTKAATEELHLQLQSLEVKNVNDLEGVFKAATGGGANALVLLASPPMGFRLKQIADFAIKNRLPSIYDRSYFPEAGGLMSYGTNNPDVFRRIATYVDKILKGANPADLPVEQPMKFELVINLTTAKQIGLTIPPNVLSRADKVIK